MSGTVKPHGRSYDRTRRRARARQTRRAILDAAITLFTAHGYGATTLQAIADEAGVAVQTIYATLKTKSAILAETLDVAIAGDDEPLTVDERDWMNGVWTAETGGERLMAYAEAVGQIMDRAGDMFTVVANAALTDPRVTDLAVETQQRRREGAARVVRSVTEVSDLASGLSPERATDVVWLLNSPAVHQQLVRAAGWSAEEYVAWLGRALQRELLGHEGTGPTPAR